MPRALATARTQGGQPLTKVNSILSSRLCVCLHLCACVRVCVHTDARAPTFPRTRALTVTCVAGSWAPCSAETTSALETQVLSCPRLVFWLSTMIKNTVFLVLCFTPWCLQALQPPPSRLPGPCPRSKEQVGTVVWFEGLWGCGRGQPDSQFVLLMCVCGSER